MQNICYNLNTMHSRAGSQVPFSSVNIGLPQSEDAALVEKIFLEEFEKGMGKGSPFIFPNIIFRVKEGINREKNDKYHYLFELASRVAAKRMNPTFLNMDNSYNLEYYNKGLIAETMGCRTNVLSDINGKPGTEGRGNAANTSINLPRVGLLADHDINKFFVLLEETIEKAKESLIYRKGILSTLKVKDIPFIAGQKLYVGSEELEDDDTIEEILNHATWGIGFVGLAETLVALLGKNHYESEEAKELGLRIVKFIRSKTDEYTEKYKMNFSCYATPAESIIYRFCKADINKFGVIEGVTDKEFYTNSFHVPVKQTISISDKLNIEAPYHSLSNGGAISYIELDDYPTGEIVENIIYNAFSRTDIKYVGINFHIRYCKECGSYLHGEEVCSCGSRKIQGISRVTGYLSLDERFGPGKVLERKNRKDHNGEHKNNYNI